MAFVIEDEEDISGDFESSPISSNNYSSNNNRSYTAPSNLSWGFNNNNQRNNGGSSKNSYQNSNISSDPYNFDLGDTDNITFDDGSPQPRKTSSSYNSHRNTSQSHYNTTSSNTNQRSVSVVNQPSNNNNNRKNMNDINNRVDEYINKYKYGNTTTNTRYVK